MNNLETAALVAKTATKIIVGSGTTKIVNDLIKSNTTNIYLTKGDKFVIAAATLAISYVVSDIVTSRISKRIDEFVSDCPRVKKKVKAGVSAAKKEK